jgi:hypothetical protein
MGRGTKGVLGRWRSEEKEDGGDEWMMEFDQGEVEEDVLCLPAAHSGQSAAV